MISILKRRFLEGWYLQQKHYYVEGLPFSFVHISDLHFGTHPDGRLKFPLWLRDSVTSAIRNSNVNVVCITGDLVDRRGNDNVMEAIRWINRLPVNNVFISLGNHDENSLDEIMQAHFLYKNKLHIGINANFQHRGVLFYCLPDINSEYFNFSNCKRFLSRKLFNIVLSHNPHGFWHVIRDHKRPTPMVLSGHTHGGQIIYADSIVKFFSKFMKRTDILDMFHINHKDDCFQLQGTYSLGNSTLYINNGLGHHRRGRFGCPPMLSIFHPAS